MNGVYIYIYIYIYIYYIYINYIYCHKEKISKETTFSSLQACFVMNSIFRAFINEKNIHNRYIYTIKFKIYMLCIICINGIIECLFSCNVIRLCFCDGMKIRVRFVCLVMTVQVGRLLEISLSGRGYIFYLSCCTVS